MKIRINHLICPWCGAEVEIDYDPQENYPAYLYDCCVCGGTFRNTKEQLNQFVRDMEKEKRTARNGILSSNYRNDVSCPVCGSTKVGLWNARKTTYHCHECDSYFNRYGRLAYDSEPVIHGRSTSFGWNGFTDPDDFPSDGFGDGGW